jgi:hypothetical protein
LFRHYITRFIALLAVAVAFGVAAGPAQAQDAPTRIRLMGYGEPAIDQRIAGLIRSQQYLPITSDTTLAAGDTIALPVLLMDATFYVDGVLLSDLIAVDAETFLRPTAEVHGDLINMGGGLYPSALARIDGMVTDRPLANYFVVRENDLIRIEGRLPHNRLVLDGVQGFGLPTYDRADGLTLRWGGSYIIGPRGAPEEPRIHAFGSYMSARGDFGGGVELRAGQGLTTARLGAERVTWTQERWIRNALENSVSFFFLADDYFNFYDARRAYARFRTGFEVGDVVAGIGATAQFENARSLRRRSVFTVFGTPRFNPPVDRGSIASLALTGEVLWERRLTELRAGGEIELAPSALGDFGFARFVVWGDWLMEAFADHFLDITWHFQGPLPGTRTRPRLPEPRLRLASVLCPRFVDIRAPLHPTSRRCSFLK